MKYEITAELHLKNIIAETREVAQALNDFADKLQQIEKRYNPCDDCRYNDGKAHAECVVCEHD